MLYIFLICALLFGCTPIEPAITATQVADPCAVTSLKPISSGGESTTNQINKQIVFTDRDSNGNYQLYSMNADASNKVNLSAVQVPGGPSQDRHKNAPSFSPNGQYIAVQTEWESDPLITHYAVLGKSTAVSNGFHTNIWVTTPNGKQWWQLTQYELTPDYGPGNMQNTYGVLGPKFSPDGQHIMWSKMIRTTNADYTFGQWRLMFADFVVNAGIPTLQNVRDITPANTNWIEPGNFTSDSQWAMVTADTGYSDQTVMDQWLINTTTEQTIQIINDPLNWDEHGRISPNSNYMSWMSSRPYTTWAPGSTAGLITEYMLLNRRSNEVRQLTHFNQSGYSEYAYERRITGGSDWQDSQHVWITTVWGGIRYPQRQLWLLTFAGACG
jgi:hypothetical protein